MPLLLRTVKANALRLEAIAIWLEAIASRLEAIPISCQPRGSAQLPESRWPAIAFEFLGCRLISTTISPIKAISLSEHGFRAILPPYSLEVQFDDILTDCGYSIFLFTRVTEFSPLL